jgi:hypothetical protein
VGPFSSNPKQGPPEKKTPAVASKDKEVGIQPETDPIFGTYKQFLKRVEISTLQILQQQPGRQGRHLS